MKGLLIEDDPLKAKKILDYVSLEYSNHDELVVKTSYQSGLKEMFANDFDYVLLDMSIPTYDQGEGNFSGKPRNFGGRDILKEMKRYKKVSRVLIVTQYNEFDGGSISIKELDEQLAEKFIDSYKGYIIYSSKQSAWKDKLSSFLNSVV